MNNVNNHLNYRDNVGIVVMNQSGLVLCGERLNYPNQWQFPQGGVDPKEEIKKAMFRELYEETGLREKNVRIISQTQDWLYYQTPKAIRRNGIIYHGQRQMWFLLKLLKSIELSQLTEVKNPEFAKFQWIKFNELISQVVEFRKQIYIEVYKEFKPYLNQDM